MSGDFSATIEGLDGLLDKLKALDYETKKKGGRSALRKAANMVRDAANVAQNGLTTQSQRKSSQRI